MTYTVFGGTLNLALSCAVGMWQTSSSLEDSYAAVLARRALAEEERRKRAEQRRLARWDTCYSRVSSSSLLLTTQEAAWYIISVLSVCQMITFESLHMGISFSLIQYISRGYRSSSYIIILVNIRCSRTLSHSLNEEVQWGRSYEGHWVKVKVTGAKYVENPYSLNVQLQLAITPLL